MKAQRQLPVAWVNQTHVTFQITKFSSEKILYMLYTHIKGCEGFYATLDTIHDVRIQRRKTKLIGWHKSESVKFPGMYTLSLVCKPKKMFP